MSRIRFSGGFGLGYGFQADAEACTDTDTDTALALALAWFSGGYGHVKAGGFGAGGFGLAGWVVRDFKDTVFTSLRIILRFFEQFMA